MEVVVPTGGKMDLKKVTWAVYGLYCECSTCAEDTPEAIKYVGQTRRDAGGRLSEHRKNTRRPRSSRIGGLPVYRWMRKHGPENIRMRILEQDLGEKIDDRERYWIKTLGTFGTRGYNMTEGGSGKSGYRHSQETKERISKKKMGLPGFSKSGLTEDQVREIKFRLWTGETQTELSEEFQVSRKTLKDISQGKVKNHIPWPIGPREKPRTAELRAKQMSARKRDHLGRLTPAQGHGTID